MKKYQAEMNILLGNNEKYLADAPRGLPQNGRGQGENRTFLI